MMMATAQEATPVSYIWRKTACLVCIMMLVFGSLAYGVDVKTSEATKFYSKPSTSSASIRLPKGISLSMSDASNGWAKVSLKGVTGYVPVKYLNSKTRAVAYVSQGTYIYAEASTSSGKKKVKVNSKVYVVGVSGDFCRVENKSGSATGYILTSCLSSKKVKASAADSPSFASGAWKSKVVKLNWYDGGSSVLKKGEHGYIYDIDTGIAVHIKRTGGSGHAECEPVSRSDTAKLMKIAGGSFDWDSHAVILYADGKFVACSISTKPHGDQTITGNGYDGQFCLHMSGSKAHEGDSVSADHESAVDRAYKWAR